MTPTKLPVILLLALTACGDSTGDPTTDPTADPTADPSTGTTADPTATTQAAPTTGTDPTATGTTADPTTTDPTTTDPTATGTTADPTGTGTADCGFDPSLIFDRLATVWQLVSDDGETCVLLTRRDDSEPDVIYKAIPYTLLSFKVGHAGVVTEFSEPAQLSWESTHHNWLDVAEAWDSGVRYHLADRYGQDFVDAFDLGAIDEQSKSPLWGPITLHPYAP